MEQKEQQYHIRPLLKRDQRVVAGMLGKLADQFNESSIRDIISSARGSGGDSGSALSEDEQKARIIRVFFDLFRRCMSKMTAEVEIWFADLIGVTPEQYEDLPIDIDVQILNQMKEAPEVERFFIGALRLFSATGWLQTLSSNLKKLYGTVTESVASSSKA